MQRLKDERGAVAVVVSIMMVMLIGFAAIAVDVSAMWSEKRQLQNGADAGALAIAQACAKGACGATTATAQSFAVANKKDGAATGEVISLSMADGKVTVRAKDPHENWFAKKSGLTSNVSAKATAKWGWPTSGATLPLAFSWCSFKIQTGGGVPTVPASEQIIKGSKTAGVAPCVGPDGNQVPGGFGWLDTTGTGDCVAKSDLLSHVSSDPGASKPHDCDEADFIAMRDKVILIPIFDHDGGTGTGAWYEIYGYAAFKITGYWVSNQIKWNDSGCGNKMCIKGYFTRFADLSEALEIGTSGPQLGATIVTLIP